MSARERNIQRLQQKAKREGKAKRKRKQVDSTMIVSNNKIQRKQMNSNHLSLEDVNTNNEHPRASDGGNNENGSNKKDDEDNNNVDDENDSDENENDSDDDDDDVEKSTIRNLLLLSLHHQPSSKSTQQSGPSSSFSSSSSSSSVLSHQTPQTLLATDMIYNSFHPSWHVRHGSLLGLLALLKSWQSSSTDHSSTSSTTTTSQSNFGRWPQDILTRCLCIISLDRFGDYSGADIKSSSNDNDNDKGASSHLGSIIKLGNGNDSNNDSNNSNNNDEERFSFDGIIQGAAMSAPVREVAARVMALLLSMSPCITVQQPTYQILVQLVNYEEEWEVRHGAMLGFKYIAELVRRQGQESDQGLGGESNNHQYMDKIWDDIVTHALKGLKDISDDVKGASAQVLCCFVKDYYVVEENENENENNKGPSLSSRRKNHRKKVNQIISQCAERIWIAMKQVHSTSSCTLDLLNLFSQIMSIDCHHVLESIGVFTVAVKSSQNSQCMALVDQLLTKMNDFLNFDDVSVRLSCFYTLSVIAEPIAVALMKTTEKGENELPSEESTSTSISSCKTIELYCNLIVNLFNSFLYDSNLFIINDNKQTTNNDKKTTNIKNEILSKMELFNDTRNKAWVAIVEATNLLLRDDNILIMRKTFLVLLVRLVDMGNNDVEGFTTSYGSFVGRSLGHSLKSKMSTQYQCLLSSCNAFAEIYGKIRLGSIIDTPIAIFILCLLESPWHELCESGCILLKSISQTIKKDETTALLISKYQSSLIKMLSRGPNCIFLDSYENIDLVRIDKSVKEMCNRTLVVILQKNMRKRMTMLKTWTGLMIASTRSLVFGLICSVNLILVLLMR